VVTGLGYAPTGKILSDGKEIRASDNENLKILLSAAGLCSNARLVPPGEESDRYTVLGDPTEACLGVAAQKAGIDMDSLSASLPRLRELPFDSSRKRMTTIHQATGSNRIAYIKGAPKEVLELCTGINAYGKREEITNEQRDNIMQANDRYARSGLRVLAVAYRLILRDSNLPAALSAYTPEIVEQDLTFVGLVVMADPPRPEVADAVALCRKASIRVIMITGDYGLTAESIAKRIGIVQGEHPRIVSGSEFADLSDDELKEALKDEVIFARVAPEQKYRVVSCLQEMGQIVAVTGDGVNDAPALKKADIGVAMGISGTDVAKEAANMILTDDNFASIVRAIEEGRAVYSNIRKFILYILNSNMSEGAPSAADLFSKGAIPLPLTVMQILAVDLGTDMMPALALGTELPEPGIMDLPPRTKKDKLLNKRVVFLAFFWYGLIASVISMGAYFYVNILNGWPNIPLAASGDVYKRATAMTLAAIVFCQVGAVLNCRTQSQSIFKVGIFSNKKVIFGIVFEICLLSAIIYVPFMQSIFNTAPIGLMDWLFLAVVPIPMVLLEELRKAIFRRYNKTKKVGGK
jgi:P-type Ca2+ transporter type 2C